MMFLQLSKPRSLSASHCSQLSAIFRCSLVDAEHIITFPNHVKNPNNVIKFVISPKLAKRCSQFETQPEFPRNLCVLICRFSTRLVMKERYKSPGMWTLLLTVRKNYFKTNGVSRYQFRETRSQSSESATVRSPIADEFRRIVKRTFHQTILI